MTVLNDNSLELNLKELASLGSNLASIITTIIALIALTSWRKQHIHSEKWTKLELLRTSFETYISKHIGYWFAEEKRLMVQNGLELFPFKKIITDENEIKQICGPDVISAHRDLTNARLEYERAFRTCSVLIELPNELNTEHIDKKVRSLFNEFHDKFMDLEVKHHKRVKRKRYIDALEKIFSDGETVLQALLKKLK